MIVDTNDKAALEQIKDFLEELPDIRRYHAAKAAKKPSYPVDKAFEMIEKTKNGSNGVLKQQKDFARQLVKSIKEQHFEYGVTSDTDNLVSKQMNINILATKSTINDLFVKNYNKADILVGLLQIISRIPTEQINPEGYNMANLAIAHENHEVKETAIRCLENWGDEKALKILQTISVDIAWLQDYVNSIINDIQEELCLT